MTPPFSPQLSRSGSEYTVPFCLMTPPSSSQSSAPPSTVRTGKGGTAAREPEPTSPMPVRGKNLGGPVPVACSACSAGTGSAGASCSPSSASCRQHCSQKHWPSPSSMAPRSAATQHCASSARAPTRGEPCPPATSPGAGDSLMSPMSGSKPPM